MDVTTAQQRVRRGRAIEQRCSNLRRAAHTTAIQLRYLDGKDRPAILSRGNPALAGGFAL